MENMNRGRNLSMKKTKKKKRGMFRFDCNITVACSICFTLSDTQYKGEGK